MHKKHHKLGTAYRLILAAIAAILLLGGGGFYLVRQAQTAYANRTQQYAYNYRKLMANTSQAIKKAGHNASDIKTSLQTADGAMQKLDAPQPTKLLGFSFQRQTDTQTVRSINSNSKKLRQELQKSIALLIYQQQLASIMASLKDTRANNADGLRAATAQWHEAHTHLAAIQPPQELQAFHQELAIQVAAVATDMGPLPDLHDKQDVNGFTAQRQKVAQQVQAVRQSAELLNVALKKQDEVMGKSASVLVKAARDPAR